ncbi:MAG: hypothetical protein FHP94_03130 [Denitromonas halophila]|nr:MAG: hypothetical protein FHP94_03130 [Denitromonas halophila]TVT72849.1 MAG: hypothetical protein FHP93_07630 [Denitromonas halophila]
MRYDPMVFDRKTVFMQRIADQVRRGYRHYTIGEVSIERAKPLAMKFARLYGVHLHRNQKARERAYGQASACVLWWHPHTDTVVFCLLLTPGPHAARSLESLRDSHARDTRLTLDEFELVLHSRPECGRPAWTWRLTQEAYEAWRFRTLEVCRFGNPYEVTQFVDFLNATPGFAGVRGQVKKVKALFRAEWKRRRPNGSTCVTIGTRQRYLQRLSNSGARLSTLTKQVHLSSTSKSSYGRRGGSLTKLSGSN